MRRTPMATNSAALLPPIPRVFFVYIEPVIIISGMVRNYASRLPLLRHPTTLPHDTLLAPSMCAAYLWTILLYGIVILLVAPPSRRLVVAHIVVLILADLVHWAAVFGVAAEMHPGGMVGVVADREKWKDEMRVMVYGPLVTFGVKVATLMGVFGRIKTG